MHCHLDPNANKMFIVQCKDEKINSLYGYFHRVVHQNKNLLFYVNYTKKEKLEHTPGAAF